MSRKTQHTRFEDNILRKFANEDKPQVVEAWRYEIYLAIMLTGKGRGAVICVVMALSGY